MPFTFIFEFLSLLLPYELRIGSEMGFREPDEWKKWIEKAVKASSREF